MIAALAPLLAGLLLAGPLEADPAPLVPPSPQRVEEAAEAPAAPSSISPSELMPAFEPDGPAAQGKAAYDALRYADAAAILQKATEPLAIYLRALSLMELSRFGEAIRVLDGLEAKLPDLADRLHYLQGQALSGAGQREAALAAFAAVPDGSLLSPDARLARARLASLQGDREAALLALSPLLSSPAPADLSRPDPGATALFLAGRLEANGRKTDLAKARRNFLACFVAHPLSPESAECQAALRGLPLPFGVPPGPDEVLERAENLLEANRIGAAIALLRPLLSAERLSPLDAALSCRIRAALGRAERRERNNPAAIELLTPVVGRCKDPGIRARALYVLAGATAIAGDRAEGILLYRMMEREFPKSPLADDALLYASELLAHEGQLPEARRVLRLLIDNHADGDQVGEARFLDAWLAKRSGDVSGAISALERVERDSEGAEPYDRARAAYWRGRFLFGLGDPEKELARSAWTDLASRYPTDYYGLLARARLSEAGAPAPRILVPKASSEPRYQALALWDDPHFRAGLALLGAGLSKGAAEELEAVLLPRVKPGERLDPILLVADLLDRAGDHKAAHQILRTKAREAFRRAPDADNLRAWLIAYPQAYRDDVERSARSAGIPADLLQGLLREESALDPRVISPAGAVGLSQLMLPTAQQVAARMRLARPTREDLEQPALNIRLGAEYLAELVKRFRGEVPLALAAYNAGATAVSRWQEAAPGVPLDEFVEEIPVEETRGYVKRVLRSYAAYATLYGEGQGPTAAELLRTAQQ